MVWVWNIHYLGIDDSFIYIIQTLSCHSFSQHWSQMSGFECKHKDKLFKHLLLYQSRASFWKSPSNAQKKSKAVLFKWKCGLLFQRNWENYWNDLHFCPPASQTESSMMHINSFKAVYCILQLNGSNHFPDNGQLERPLAKWLWSLSRLL